MGLRYISLAWLLFFAIIQYIPPLLPPEKVLQKVNLRDKVLGELIKNRLETMHFRNMKIDEDVSVKAFDLYIKKLDYTKMYLYASDVESLKKYSTTMHEALVSGDIELIRASTKVFKQRLKQIKTYVTELLRNPVDFKAKEYFEGDTDKRSFTNNWQEQKEQWRLRVKDEILSRYLQFKKEQDKRTERMEKMTKKEKKKYIAEYKKDNKDEDPILDQLNLEKKARESVQKSYRRLFIRLGQDDHEDELNRFFNSIAEVFDPHTNYFPPKSKEDFDMKFNGQLEGIGALLSADGPYIKVEKIMPGSASWKQKSLKAGDLILQVAQGDEEPVDVVDMRIDNVVRYIRGKKGTEVRLTVRHPNGETEVISIIRDVVKIEEAFVKGMIFRHDKIPNKKFGYIYVPSFYRDLEAKGSDQEVRNCTDDVRKQLIRFKREGVHGIVLDLRGNFGGVLDDAQSMTGLFIKNGPVVQVKRSDGSMRLLSDDNVGMEYTGPLVVLVNRFSASAPEILAAALQDYGRAVIVGGDHTHGKGTVQVLMNLDNSFLVGMDQLRPLGAFKVTIQKYYRINGGSTQFTGVIPDLILPDNLAHIESGERYLDYALSSDNVSAVPYNRWPRRNWDLEILRRKSMARVNRSQTFALLKENIEFMKKRKDDTLSPLKLEEAMAKVAEVEKQNKKSKEMNIFVPGLHSSKLESSAEMMIDRSKKDHLSEKERKELNENKTSEEEFIEERLKDVYLEESFYILRDMF